MSNIALCRHCGLPYSGGQKSDRVDSSFCCFGCAIAFEVVHRSGEDSTGLSPMHVRIAVAVILSMAVMMFSLISYSDFVGDSPVDAAAVAFSQVFSYMAFLCSVPVLMLLGTPMLRRISDARRGHSIWLEILAMGGIAAAFVLSSVNLLRGHGHTYFETVVFTLLLWSVGRYVEALMRTRAMTTVRDSISVLQQSVAKILDTQHERTEHVSAGQLQIGDVYRLYAGDTVPVDGTIVRGRAYIDTSTTTGEYLPERREPNDELMAGMTIIDATVDVKVTEDPAQGGLVRLQQDVSMALTDRGVLQRASDRSARALAMATSMLGMGTFLYWWQIAGVEAATMNALSVFLVACPCSLGIAVPLVVYFGMQKARHHGVLYRSGEALERAGTVNKIFLDRTGTLTTGLPRFVGAWWSEEAKLDRRLVWGAVVSAARQSRHPLSQAIVSDAHGQDDESIALQSCRTVAGSGLIAEISNLDGPVRIGSATMMQEARMIVPNDITTRLQDTSIGNHHYSFVGVGDRVVSLLEFEECGGQESMDILHQLEKFHPEIITGGRGGQDLPWPIHRGVTPDGKRQLVDKARAQKQRVAMVGDGLNDAVALSSADLSVAVHNAQGVNHAVADVRLLMPGLPALVPTFAIARTARRRMWQNIGWSIGYNSLGLALATTGHLHPFAAALAMFGSSLFVLWNSRRWLVG